MVHAEKVCTQLTIALLLLGLSAVASASPPVEGAVLERRQILVLVDDLGQSWKKSPEDPAHEVLEMPLNYLGMVVRRHNIRHGPPPEEWTRDLRAVVTCFPYSEKGVDWLWPWLRKMAADPEVRFLHFIDFGALAFDADGKKNLEPLKQWLGRFGLGYDDFYAQGPLGIDVTYRDRDLCAFETDPILKAIHGGPWLTAEGQAAGDRVWVTTRYRLDPKGVRTPVVTGPWGGVALDPWFCNLGTGNGDRRWYLDPFVFLREALALDRVPAPHPAVLNGRRMFFLHVDGDGFESISTVLHGRCCGEVFLEEILEKYDLPMTVSVIVRGLTDDYTVEEPTDMMLAARKVLAHRNVEPGSHGVLHPFAWQPLPEELARPNFQRNGFASIRNFDWNYINEVRGSIQFINDRLLTKGRRCAMMLWTGDCIPRAEPVRESYRQGALNINGGTYRWDDFQDSISYVPGWGRVLGDAVQVYCGAGNENIYKGFFSTMPTVFKHVNTTIERTGRGRILKPANIYIHFYCVERPGRLRTLRELIQRWAFDEPTAPVFASDYAGAVVDAVFGARVYRTPSGWSLREFGRCRTARIDHEPRDVDFKRSTGLLGARRVGPALYLHLAGPDADVVLADHPPVRPHVEQANHRLTDAALFEKGLAVTSEALSRRIIVFAGLPPGAEVELVLDGEGERRRTDDEGRLEVLLEKPGRTRVEVRSP